MVNVQLVTLALIAEMSQRWRRKEVSPVQVEGVGLLRARIAGVRNHGASIGSALRTIGEGRGDATITLARILRCVAHSAYDRRRDLRAGCKVARDLNA